MPVDPTEPESVEELLDRSPGDETPEADAAEQRAEAQGGEGSPAADGAPYGADPADVAEQARAVEVDEDDYR